MFQTPISAILTHYMVTVEESFVNGNATFNNLSFEKYMAAEDYAGGIFVYAGNSTIANSKFNGPDAIWVNESAIAYLINNYITGSNQIRILLIWKSHMMQDTINMTMPYGMMVIYISITIHLIT